MSHGFAEMHVIVGNRDLQGLLVLFAPPFLAAIVIAGAQR